METLGNYFRLSKNGNYRTALISSVYDVSNKIPIFYGIYNHFNERAALLDQLEHIRANDIVIVDRGYFSNEVLLELHKRNIKVIFRIKSNLKIIQNLKKNTKDLTFDYNVTNSNIKMRLIKYEVNNNIYFLFTNIIDKKIYPTKTFYDLYKKRWSVETDFFYAKRYLSMDHLNSKTVNGIRKEIYIHNFIQIIDMLFQKELSTNIIRENYKINKKNSLFILGEQLLHLILYNNITKKLIDKILKLLGLIIKNNNKF